MKFIVFLISAFAFEQLSKDLKNSIATNLDPFSEMKMTALSPKIQKKRIYEIVKVPQNFYPFELFQNATTEGFFASDKNGCFDESINLHRGNDRGESFTYTAALNGHLEFVKALAQHGVDLNKPGNHGFIRAPFHIAAANGHIKIVQILAEHGVDLNKADWGDTPVLLAAEYGQSEVVQFLAEQGADLNKANKNGVTPVEIAAFKEYTEVVKVLIESKAKLNKKLILLAKTVKIKQMIENALEK